jgi:hypothetical protein
LKKLLAFTMAAALTAVGAAAGPFPDYNQGILSNDARIVGWATGWQNYVQPHPFSGGFCHDNSNQSNSIDSAVLGAPTDFTLNGTTKHLLSLGHGASITLTFGQPILRQGSWNFAVFNNAFLSTAPGLVSRGGGTNYVYDGHGTNLAPVARGDNFVWCKPAFVDVSSDATNWARFPVTYWNTDTLFQASVPDTPDHWLSQDVTMIDGLAGKSILQYGTPFSLSALTNSSPVISGSVNLDNIRYIRLTDVIGDGSTTDQYGNLIRSPYYDGAQLPALVATPDSSTDGFCLRGVAILETPAPTIGGAGMAQTSFLIDVSGLFSGQTYCVQTTTNLAATAWTNETNFAASDNSATLTNNFGNTTKKFYRIGVTP